MQDEVTFETKATNQLPRRLEDEVDGFNGCGGVVLPPLQDPLRVGLITPHEYQSQHHFEVKGRIHQAWTL